MHVHCTLYVHCTMHVLYTYVQRTSVEKNGVRKNMGVVSTQ